MVNEYRFKIADKPFRFQWLKGKVLEVKSLARTVGGGQVWVSPHQTTSSNITIRSVEQLDIFLEDASGAEHAFKLEDFNFSCRKGHEITIVKLLAGNNRNGPFVGLENHNTENGRVKYGLMHDMVRPSSALTWLLALTLPFAIWFLYIYALEILINALGIRDNLEAFVLLSIIATLFTVPIVWLMLYFGYQRKKAKRRKMMTATYNGLKL